MLSPIDPAAFAEASVPGFAFAVPACPQWRHLRIPIATLAAAAYEAVPLPFGLSDGVADVAARLVGRPVLFRCAWRRGGDVGTVVRVEHVERPHESTEHTIVTVYQQTDDHCVDNEIHVRDILGFASVAGAGKTA